MIYEALYFITLSHYKLHLDLSLSILLKGAIRDRFGIPSIAGSAASFCFTSIPSRKFTISHRNTF